MKILLGGSPCTYWSIARTKNRETEPSGIGWELFENDLIALQKFHPDYFLYENNKSMAPAIRAEITKRLGVDPICINSALVSAQNRQRLYWVGKRNPDGTYSRVDVPQPEDRGIMLRDILETGVSFTEKAYTLKAQYYKSSTANMFGGHFTAPMKAEPVNATGDGKSQCLRAAYYKDGIRNMLGNNVDRKTCVAEPIRIGTIESVAKNADFDSQQYRVYSPDGKSATLCGQGGGVGAKTGLYAVPANCDVVVTDANIRCQRRDKKHSTIQGSHVSFESSKSQTMSPSHVPSIIEPASGKAFPVYEVRNGLITIKGKQYPIKLKDGYYVIRKLTVTECKRLQTVPDDYISPSPTPRLTRCWGTGGR